ncbi:putative ubiquitin carboxyl-terminal hydrolase [Lyophyllum shimeji]|uniref:Ubiquitin carboxyl-terminal hydrolase n=1 Tax=Lyophyllum shimeji TaxID=47721 RepID=A0A9P3PYB0_LYOSH|nr:putative ubiquitin carboxyl-terminal hydrolase [Lyophyllum shimeji]
MSINRWIPLESNPEVLNKWSEKAGLLTARAAFQDVYGLDPELLAMVNQPVKAVVLLFPITDALEAKRREEDQKITNEGPSVLDSTVLWIKQTIPNACGTIGLLHALANSNVELAPNSPLARFIEECKAKTPEERAKHLETTPLFANIHAEAASGGQTAVPTDLDTDLHFTCFVQAGSPGAYRIVELDGRRAGPVDRGALEKDLLTDVAKIVKETYVSNTSSVQFSMVALGGPPEV